MTANRHDVCKYYAEWVKDMADDYIDDLMGKYQDLEKLGLHQMAWDRKKRIIKVAVDAAMFVQENTLHSVHLKDAIRQCENHMIEIESRLTDEGIKLDKVLEERK